MNDVATPRVELSAGDIISNGISIGLKNFISVILTYIVFILTIWIPYLNVGTIIAMQDLVPKISRGESVSPGYIFDAKYRQNFGEFFILLGLYMAGLYAAFIFFVIPGIVVAFAWMFALNLFVDKDTGPLESLRMSNRMTYGNKLPIFFSVMIVGIGLSILQFIAVLSKSTALLIIYYLIQILVLPIMVGMFSYVYSKLTSALDSPPSFDAEMVDPTPSM